MKIEKILEGIAYQGDGSVEVTHIESDSRKVTEGCLFVCVKGYETDGHKYAKMAEEKGAAAILAQDEISVSCPVIYVKDSRRALAHACNLFHGKPSEKFTLIGITGTNGKTTTTFLIKQILEYAGQKVGLIGTNQNMIGDEIIETSRTTPDSFELQALFARMAEAKVDTVVMEVSSHALYLDRVYGCDFDVGVFTNLTQDHLDFHKTMENYAEAKAILFSRCKKGVVNMDDKWSSVMLGGSCAYTGYSVEKESALHATHICLNQENVTFNIGEVPFVLGIPGKFSVYNALSAIGATASLGLELPFIAEALKHAKGVKGRAEVVDLGFDFTVLIDYAHTPDGLENILKTAKGFAKGRVIALFGCGGDRDATKRPIMGDIATTLADYAIVTSDNPRTEDPDLIIEDVVKGIKSDNYCVFADRREAIVHALQIAKKDDVIVLAGKGHEDYQVIGKEKVHFDETEILTEIRDKMSRGE
ncbi:MAG: UDP-N-acetylmuramoyl-L-alanyl-D-glutamate--2,6-diaminopimelate ligase [Clostridia bacterium]|nr:UDP-N-acetylmuramoyl-L-alanyl-D-glutamate--2,6-diaminopimelate ligase [Clostridia bacterium]